MNKVSVFAFSEYGAELSLKLKSLLDYNYDVEGYYKKEYPQLNKIDKPLSEVVEDSFKQSNIIIFIGAVAIAVRLIAPYLKSKVEDPAIICIDDGGSYVIPILSGHIGQANKYALDIASLLDAIPVITTSTDIHNVFAIDVFATKNNLLISNPAMIKYISTHLLENNKVGFVCDYQKVNTPDFIDINNKDIGICISEDINKKPFKKTINLIHKKYVLGVGLRKDKDSQTFEEFILNELKENKIDIKLVSEIVSIDLKKDEKALKDFACKYRLKMQTFSSEQLNNIKGEFSSSQFVKSITGVDNVCERSLAYVVGYENILTKKKAHDGMTIAIGIRPFALMF
ncbi:MAG: cobalamin biosynthesis protein [Erysipelotrichales bacterium]